MKISILAKENLQKEVILDKVWDNADLIIEYLRLFEVEFVPRLPYGAIEPLLMP
jgi:hypothetical protein